MTYMQALLGFAVLAGAMAMVPGLDMVMTMNEAIHYGRRNGIMAGFGIQCGVLVWAVAASLGLAALISAFPLAYDIIRVIGGMYLFYLAWSMSGMSDWAKRKLGVATKQTEMQPREAADDSTASTESVARSMIAPTSRPSLFSSWWRGFLTDFFNPKIGVFYIAVIPQFLVSGVGNLQMGLSLGLIHAIEGGLCGRHLLRQTHQLTRQKHPFHRYRWRHGPAWRRNHPRRGAKPHRLTEDHGLAFDCQGGGV